MKSKLLWALLVLAASLLLPASSFAQFTQVTATVTDPNGLPYSFGTVSAVLTPSTPGGYRLLGQPYSGQLGITALDSTGTFTANMGDVSQITPSGAQWVFTIGAPGIPPPQGFGAQSFTYTSTGTQVTGSSVNLSTSISAAALTQNASLGRGGISIVATPFSATPNFAYTKGSQETSFSLQLTGNVTSSTVSGPFVGGSDIQLIICQDGTGGRTFAWPSTFLNVPTVPSGANGCAAGTWVFCGTTGGNACPANQWQNTDQTPVTSPTTGQISASLATNVTYVTDPAYGVNVQNEFLGSDLTWSNAQGPVSVASTASDFPFTAAMNGLDCWGLSAGSVTIPVGTFTFTDTTHGTCSSTSTNSAAGNGTFTVLNNNNAAMHAAGTAFAAKCGTFEMPAGYIEITSTDILPAQPAKCQLTPSFASGWHIKGQGHMATWIIPRPGTTYVSTGGACFFSGSLNTQLDNFSIQGLGQTLSGINTNCSTLLYVAQASHLSDVGVFSIGAAATNTPRPLNIGSQGGVAFNFYADFGPQGGIACGGPDAAIEHSYNSDITGGIALEVVAGGICYSRGNRWDCGSTAIQVDTNGFLDSIDDYSGNLGSCVFLRMNGNPSSAKLINYENGFVTSACATCYGIYGGAANWKVSAIGSTIPGSTTNGFINAANAGTFTDLGDNTLFGNLITPGSLSYIADGHSMYGTCTGVATSSQAALALYGTGPNSTTTTCANATVGSGIGMTAARTIKGLIATSTATGSTAGSGAVTLLKNGVAQTMTCTIGNVNTSCSDFAHPLAAAAGDLLSLSYATGAAETLANLRVLVVW